MVFRRGRKNATPAGAESEDVFGPLDGADVDEVPEGEDGLTSRTGPWDSAEAPDDGLPRLDLGALLIPAAEGAEIRVEVNEAQQVVAATVVAGNSALQILAFAAPRSAGIWDEIRGEIAASIRADGGTTQEVEGPFGTELRARAVGRDQRGAEVSQILRFTGVDGPRWFLRGVFTGPAATDEKQAAVLESVLRDVVVVRGDEAMAPRDALPLRLPREAAQAAQEAAERAGEQAGQDQQQVDRHELPDPFERGPEITETR